MSRRIGVACVSVVLGGLALASAAGEWPAKLAPAAAAQDARHDSSLRAPRLPETPYGYAALDLPEHFTHAAARQFDTTPTYNPVTDAGATLGRVLFYDTRLSANGTISCASCHLQAHAFDDPRRFSVGFEGGTTDRHAMPLVNLRYHPRGRYFWDERAHTLEAAVLLPIEDRLEMGQDLAILPDVLALTPFYPDLFDEAFGDPAITTERIARALAQFLRAMVSYRSPYDEGRAAVTGVADDFPNFTREENRGKALFLRNCAICHLPDQEAHFVMTTPASSGIDADPRTSDGGVGDITLDPRDLGLFKTPSLRNVEVTAPYMHDGRFDTLEAVIDHYSGGGAAHPNRDIRIQPLGFTTSERSALVAFLRTLTDPGFLEDPRFSNPFD